MLMDQTRLTLLGESPCLLQVLPDGQTGRVAFDEMGDRIHAEYRILNVQEKAGFNRRRKDYERGNLVGHYQYSKVL